MDLARRRRMDEDTVPFKKSIAGNDLFDRAVEGEDPTLAAVLSETLTLLGIAPEELTPEQLGNVLPEVERRLRLVVGVEETRSAMAGLRKVLMGWEE
jgi:hypothetical protein